MPKTLEFFFDLASPYSYLASTQVEAVAARTHAVVDWRPVFVHGLMKATGNSAPTSVPAKAMYLFKDLNDWASHYGLPPLLLPEGFPVMGLTADRVAIATGPKLVPFVKVMFRRIWAEQADCNLPAVLEAAITEVGLEPIAVLERAQTAEVKNQLKANTDLAIERGAFGVPTFFVGEEMFVGNDRLQFVERALAR